MSAQPLTIVLAAPRGFCAGVDRAIKIVERTLEKYGAPVYVRHEIVHNKFVVDSLKDKGAIFVEELDDIPAGSNAPVIFSAHGVPKSVVSDAAAKNFHYLDATCPLVSKVHREAERHHKDNRHLILIGHRGHPEVIGTMGQLPDGMATLVETVADVASLNFAVSDRLAYATQTTLSVDETADIVAALTARYPDIAGPLKEDICYATTNRQAAVKQLAAQTDAVLVLGAPNSSNSKRLVETARLAGVAKANLLQRAADLDLGWLDGVARLGVTAGASAPEVLVEELIARLRSARDVTVEILTVVEENVEFKLPRELQGDAAA